MPRSPAQNEEIRQARRVQIMDAARQVFARRGFHATRMSDIASAAGVSQGTLYHYFQSKDELFLSLLNVWNDRMVEVIQNAPGEAVSAVDKFWLINQVGQAFVAADEELAPVLVEFWAYSLHNPEAAASFRRFFQTVQQTLSDFFAEGIAAGEFKTVDVETLSALPLILLDGVVLLSAVMGRDLINPQQLLEKTQQLIFDGLLLSDTREAE